jgi:hypothetical protein
MGRGILWPGVFMRRFLCLLAFVFLPVSFLGIFPIACTKTLSVPTLPNPGATATPTVTATPAIPMGLFVGGSFQGLFANTSFYGGGISVTIMTEFDVSINQTAETTDAITLTTPVEGAVPVTYWQTSGSGGVSFARYMTTLQYTYVPNATYSASVSTSLGTVTSTMSAPGSITFSASANSVTAAYPGNYDYGVVQEQSPAVVVTYQSVPGPSVGSPFTFPATAFSSPAIFGNTYGAALTVTYTGPAATGSYFAGNQQLTTYVSK